MTPLILNPISPMFSARSAETNSPAISRATEFKVGGQIDVATADYKFSSRDHD
jgi:hypothetical protein